MTSYFWSGFPSLSGRSDVMYGRRHIGGATHPLRHPYRLGLSRYRSAYQRCSVSGRAIASILASSSSWRLTTARLARVNGANGERHRVGGSSCPRRADQIEISFRLDDGDAQLCINPYGAYPCTANWPERASERASERAARAAGTFQLLEGITTSVHHLLYLFSAHDHYDRRGKD